jgi:hypothetical protein
VLEQDDRTSKRLLKGRDYVATCIQYVPGAIQNIPYLDQFCSPTEGQRSLRLAPQLLNTDTINKATIIIFATFMISEIYSKLQQSEPTLGLLSEIHTHWNENEHPSPFALRKDWGEWTPIAAEQWALHSKANSKLPEWTQAGCLFERRSLEQCTSSAVAKAKAHFFHSHIPIDLPVLDLCAGFGVDAWAWSQLGRTVTAVERDPALHNLAVCNLSFLPQGTKRVLSEAEAEYPKWAGQSVLFLVDPDRRDGDKRLGASLEAYQPNIWPWLEQRKPEQHWLIKLSPITDFQALHHQINQPFDAYWVALGSETKELLLHVHDKARGQKEILFVHESGFADTWTHLQAVDQHSPSESPLLFEPHSSAFAARFNREMVATLYQSATPNGSFFETDFHGPKTLGRRYRIEAKWEGSLNSIQRELAKLQVSHASVTVRESKLSAEEVRKKLGLQESSQRFVFATQTRQGFIAWLVSAS